MKLIFLKDWLIKY